MALLNLRQMLRDEGLLNTARILGNVLTKPAIKSRVLEMRRVFSQYQQELGYIAVCAIAQPGTGGWGLGTGD